MSNVPPEIALAATAACSVASGARPFLNKKYDEGNDQRYGYYQDVSIPENPILDSRCFCGRSPVGLSVCQNGKGTGAFTFYSAFYSNENGKADV